MNTTTVAVIVIAGLVVGGGLLLRRRARQSTRVPRPTRRKPARKRVRAGFSCSRVPVLHAPATRRQCAPQWRLRLNREERRQRPGEARN